MSSGGWTGFGYVFSILSVAMLAAVAWPSARDDPEMQWALAAGVLLSIAGMIARWIAHHRDGKRLSQLED